MTTGLPPERSALQGAAAHLLNITKENLLWI
jgi:hypothetical protein